MIEAALTIIDKIDAKTVHEVTELWRRTGRHECIRELEALVRDEDVQKN